VGGMSDACRVLNTPVTGGNVSFYNENPKSSVFPTPTIGMLGLLENVEEEFMTPAYEQADAQIYYVGAPRKGLGGSEYLSWNHGLTEGDAPEFDLEYEARLHKFLLEIIHSRNIQSAHDCSDGGLLACLTEKSVFSEIGATIDTTELREYSGTSIREVYFSEAQSGVVISLHRANVAWVQKKADAHGISCIELGVTGGDQLTVDNNIDLDVEVLDDVYEGVLPEIMNT